MRKIVQIFVAFSEKLNFNIFSKLLYFWFVLCLVMPQNQLDLNKVIIEKSRGEVSLIEQDTIENIS